MSRPETGPMNFEEDWNGLFIRGDDALGRYLPAVRWAFDSLSAYTNNPTDVHGMLLYRFLGGLVELLESVNQTVEKDVEVTRLKLFKECVRTE